MSDESDPHRLPTPSQHPVDVIVRAIVATADAMVHHAELLKQWEEPPTTGDLQALLVMSDVVGRSINLLHMLTSEEFSAWERRQSRGGATFHITANFADADPDRIAQVFQRDMVKLAENPIRANTSEGSTSSQEQGEWVHVSGALHELIRSAAECCISIRERCEPIEPVDVEYDTEGCHGGVMVRALTDTGRTWLALKVGSAK